MSTYEINGLKLPSVTTIIGDCTDKSSALTYWAANCVVEWIKSNCGQQEIGYYLVTDKSLESARKNFREVSQEALDVGSEVHAAIEKYTDRKILDKGASIRDIVDSLSPQAANAFGAFLSWADENKFDPIESEKTVYGWYWAGTEDVVCYLNGKKTVIDYKTSKGHYPEHRYQIAAYRSCDDDIEHHGVLRLDKATGEPSYKDYSKSYEKDLAVLRAMVNLYFLRHPVVSKRAGVPF